MTRPVAPAEAMGSGSQGELAGRRAGGVIISRPTYERLSNVRRDEPLQAHSPEEIRDPSDEINPEHQALLVDAVGAALVVVLDTLTPAERLAFVLHDIFAVPFDEIATILGRSPSAARKLASRARLRVQATTPAAPDPDLARHHGVVDAFLTASQSGDFDALLEVLAPDVKFHADNTAVKLGAPRKANGAPAVAGIFLGRAHTARLALVNRMIGAVWAPSARPKVVFTFSIKQNQITKINLLADPHRLREIDLTLLDG